MSLSDPIADMLTRIRNAARVRHKTVNVRASGICEGIAGVLKEEGYIDDYVRIDMPARRKQAGDGTEGSQGAGPQGAGLLRVYLRYGPSGEQVITELTRTSKPGKRVYSGADDLPRPMDGLGVAIVSTSKGVLSDRRCREENVGGEVLCTVC